LHTCPEESRALSGTGKVMGVMHASVSGGVIVWDFDQTLGMRPGSGEDRPAGLRGCLLEILDLHEPGHSITARDIEPYVQADFPWNGPAVAHRELSDPIGWWEHVEPLLIQVYEGVGIDPVRARTLGRLARERYVDPRHWRLFEDTVPVLRGLRARGWRHLILSNHVPELEQIITDLGLRELVDAVVVSAEIGFEKPHPEAFAYARQAAGACSEIWMIGDDPHADIAGARAAGIPAIHVRDTRRPLAGPAPGQSDGFEDLLQHAN
jgi:putative hydrolase of the HAD superfamily